MCFLVSTLYPYSLSCNSSLIHQKPDFHSFHHHLTAPPTSIFTLQLPGLLNLPPHVSTVPYQPCRYSTRVWLLILIDCFCSVLSVSCFLCYYFHLFIYLFIKKYIHWYSCFLASGCYLCDNLYSFCP